MCGPADYHALQTCILRIVGLSIAGLAALAVQRRLLKSLQEAGAAHPDSRTAL
jgi:hypothetical protein